MVRQDNQRKYLQLRKEFPFFVYEAFKIAEDAHSYSFHYTFSLADRFYFTPSIILPKKHFYASDLLALPGIKNLAFHIGMIELISYWKAACPPKLIIKPFSLNQEQIEWWKKIYHHGLGEFFYMNSIETDSDDFMAISSSGTSGTEPLDRPFTDGYSVPVGGGKDSAVTLELLKTRNIRPFVINPRGAIVGTITQAGMTMQEAVVLNRHIHPTLLELNAKGFLNGHTPFSALVAFTSLLAPALTGYRSIALSNESSSSEATLPGTEINHQYSKSFEFEKDFRWYVKKYISDSINYFSILRPLNELQIARRFSRLPRYFYTFKSCNVGSKTDTWCGECPKCLFSYIILSPFIDQETLINIFGKNLLENENLLGIFEQLTGIAKEKPFECVGTIDETNVAVNLLVDSIMGKELPFLLKHYLHKRQSLQMNYTDSERLLNDFDSSHFLSDEEVLLLKNLING